MTRQVGATGGFTLLEVLVVLAVLTILLGLAAAAPVFDPVGEGLSDAATGWSMHQRRAMREGRAVVVVAGERDIPVTLLFLPDGRVIGAEAVGLDPLTGARQ